MAGVRFGPPAAAVLAATSILLLASGLAAAQPFQPGLNLSPLGNLRTTDRDGVHLSSCSP